MNEETATPEVETPEAPKEVMIPKARLDQVISERNTLKEQLEAIQSDDYHQLGEIAREAGVPTDTLLEIVQQKVFGTPKQADKADEQLEEMGIPKSILAKLDKLEVLEKQQKLLADELKRRDDMTIAERNQSIVSAFEKAHPEVPRDGALWNLVADVVAAKNIMPEEALEVVKAALGENVNNATQQELKRASKAVAGSGSPGGQSRPADDDDGPVDPSKFKGKAFDKEVARRLEARLRKG